MTEIHPAITQHAMEDNERLRGLLEELHPYVRGCSSELWDRYHAAISQHAEPMCETMQRPKAECGCPDCGSSLIDWPKAEPEPAPAQDEREVAAVIGFYEGEREPRLLSWNALPNGEHRLYTHPAQTEQQLVPVPGLAEAPSRVEAVIVAIRDLWDEDECPAYPVVATALRGMLYAAPIAQTASAQDEREAFEGWSVSANKYHASGYNPHSDLSEAFHAGVEWQRTRPAQTEQQPVAVVKENNHCPEGLSDEISEYLPHGTKLYATPIAHPDAALREQIRSMTAMLENREWANLLSTDEDIARLDSAITALVGERSADRAALSAVTAEAEALRKDAERYQWVSSGLHEAETLVSIVNCHGGHAEKVAERVDVYREAAMAAKGV